jgi:hypothetical protein
MVSPHSSSRTFSTYRNAALFAAVGVLVSLGAGQSARADAYTFENFDEGPMPATDGWYSTNAVLEAGDGYDSSIVFDSPNNQGPVYVVARRNLDVTLGLPAPTAGTKMILGLDFRIPVSSRTEAGFSFGYAPYGTGNPTSGSFGLDFQWAKNSSDRLMARLFGGGSADGGAAFNFNDAHGEWYHAEILCDFTGPRALGSLYIQNLTWNRDLTPVSSVQNVDLGFDTSAISTLDFSSLYLVAGNVQVDNLVISSFIPEPASLAVLGLGAAALLARRSRR